MANWKERMYCGIGEYLRSTGLDVIEVIDLEENVYVTDLGGCETCGPEYDKEFSVTIYYKDSKKKNRTADVDGSFVDFINSIT